MKVTAKEIRKFDPCRDRIENFEKHYPEFNGSYQEFLALGNITYSDKVWVMTRLMTTEQNVKWSILCAESVLHIFEARYPNAKRPREAIEAAKKGDAADAAAYAAAYATAYATAYAAYAYADTARAAANAEKNQEQLNLSFILQVLNNA